MPQSSQHGRYRKPTTFDRRTFLRGGSLALSLPWMASLQGSPTTPQPPLRTAFIYFPNGVWEKSWVPEQTGKDFQLPFSLQPLEDLRHKVTVLSGLDKKHSHGGDGHYAKTANFLTGMPVAKTTGRNISSGGISADQLLAKHLSGSTPIPSLELSTEPVISGVDSNVGYTRLYGSHISWQSPTRPVARELNPRVVYERLFGRQLHPDQQKAESYRNLLDFVLEDAQTVRKTLGRDDQFKMDEYLDSVRAVERQIEYSTRQHKDRWEPEWNQAELANRRPGIPGDFREHIDIMLDLMVLAFQTNATQICTLMFANDVSGRSFSFVDGVKGGHHQLSHHENKAEKIQQYERINRWHVETFARMLKKMDAVKEGERTLLDHSQILFGSSFSDGNRHDPDNLPILLAGSASGKIQPGRHIAAEGQRPLCNLYLSMLNNHGLNLKSFGDSTDALALS